MSDIAPLPLEAPAFPAPPADPMVPTAPPEPPPPAPTRADTMAKLGLGEVGAAARGLHNVKASLRNAGEMAGLKQEPARKWLPKQADKADFLKAETLDEVAEAAWQQGGHGAEASDEHRAYLRAFTYMLGEKVASGVPGHVDAARSGDDLEDVAGQAAALELSKFTSTLPILARSSEKARRVGRSWKQFVKDPAAVPVADQAEMLDFVSKFASATSWLKGAEFTDGDFPLVAVAGMDDPVPVFGWNRQDSDSAEAAPAKVLGALSDRFTDGLVDVKDVVAKQSGAVMIPHDDGTVTVMGDRPGLKDQLRTAYPCALTSKDKPVWMPVYPDRVANVDEVRRKAQGRVSVASKGDLDPALTPGNFVVVQAPDLGTEELIYAHLRKAGFDSSSARYVGDALVEQGDDQKVVRTLVVDLGEAPVKDSVSAIVDAVDQIEAAHGVSIDRSLYLHGGALAPRGYHVATEEHYEDFAGRTASVRTAGPGDGPNVTPVYVRKGDLDRLPPRMHGTGVPASGEITFGEPGADAPDGVIRGKVGFIEEPAPRSSFVIWRQEGRLPVVAPSMEKLQERFSLVDPAQVVEVSKRGGKLGLKVRPSLYDPEQPDELFAVKALEVLEVLGLRSDDVNVTRRA